MADCCMCGLSVPDHVPPVRVGGDLEVNVCSKKCLIEFGRESEKPFRVVKAADIGKPLVDCKGCCRSIPFTGLKTVRCPECGTINPIHDLWDHLKESTDAGL